MLAIGATEAMGPLRQRIVVASLVTLGGAGCQDQRLAWTPTRAPSSTLPSATVSVVDKVDLLLMIDDSPSMADKQAILAAAVPDLVARLTDPPCVDGTSATDDAANNAATERCPPGEALEFPPVEDLHIGVITSSLGGAGSDACADASMRGMAHLLTNGTSGPVATYAGKGFLQWDPASRRSPPGESDAGALSRGFAELVGGAGESGCEYEQSLEAVYRFLIDPDPYERVTVSDNGLAVLEGLDETLLAERRDFLRPDSLVAIVSLSDEDDCSMDPMAFGGQGWLNWQSRLDGGSYFLPPGTTACEANPNDDCCVNCMVSAPPGCLQPEDDPRCAPDAAPTTDSEQALKLRCFDEERQFGVTFLHPVERYLCAIEFDPVRCTPSGRRLPSVTWKARKVPDRSGDLVDNPLFSDLQGTGRPGRDPDLVVWAMIVGVPWQDIARDPHDLAQGYMDTDELSASGRWGVIVGDPAASPPVLPADPLMFASIEPRTGVNPVTQDPLAPPGSAARNPINGQERDTSLRRDDLQYACAFPSTDASEERTAHAYPGLRHLQVARGLGSHAVVASICPANLAEPTARDYGYRPAIDAIVERIWPKLVPNCVRYLSASPPDDAALTQLFEPE